MQHVVHPNIEARIFQDEDNVVLVAKDTMIEYNGHKSIVEIILSIARPLVGESLCCWTKLSIG